MSIRVSESAAVSIGNSLESLVGKFAVILVVVFVIASLLGNPEAGMVMHKVKPRNTPGSPGNWRNGKKNPAITQQQWQSAVAFAAGR
jgi:hypothetical protein